LNGRTQTSEIAIAVATREVTRLEKVVYGAVAAILLVVLSAIVAGVMRTP